MAVNRSGREADRSLLAVQTLKMTTHLYLPTIRIPVSLLNYLPEQLSVHRLESSSVLPQMSTFIIRKFIFFMLLLDFENFCLTSRGEMIAKDNFST
jgi:hypothetical protein